MTKTDLFIVLLSQSQDVMAIFKNLQDLTSIISLASFCLLMYAIVRHYRRLMKLPPGPWGYPVVGMCYSIKKYFHLFLMDNVKKFGKIISLKMGSETIVVLSDYRLIKKAFQSRDFSARPKTEFFKELLGGFGKWLPISSFLPNVFESLKFLRLRGRLRGRLV